MSAPESHAETAARLLREVAERRDEMTEMERWEQLTAANAHAMLANYEGNQQGLALMSGYRDDLHQAVEVDRQRLELAKQAGAGDPSQTSIRVDAVPEERATATSAQSRADKIAAAIVPEQLDTYLPKATE